MGSRSPQFAPHGGGMTPPTRAERPTPEAGEAQALQAAKAVVASIPLWTDREGYVEWSNRALLAACRAYHAALVRTPETHHGR